ncbi:MAG TPA: hypothetical protein VGK74_05075 [Symbiobacteriaceae bacterium]|jgi:Tfp pilus assembly protein PilN
MTVRINFLPRTYQPPKRLEARQWGVALAAVTAMAAIGMYYTSVYAGTVKLGHETEATQLKLQQVKAGLAQATDIKAREDKVTKAEADLKSLTGRHWSSVLLDLRESTPQHVTWTGLKVAGNSITLHGTNRGLVDVAQLLGSLVNDKNVEQVNLRYINEKGIPITFAAKGTSASGALTPGAPTSGALTPGILDNGGKQTQPDPLPAILGTFRQMEFEMEIILVGSEGGKPENGA